ncbi:uncharacterized protein [Rutidosis leptorrhynchoides]|uniref:uncharacterized protein n=1 Tax=Rutidosis leptorrhynchoides TaxID=125765 RepID=UPI003A9A315B
MDLKGEAIRSPSPSVWKNILIAGTHIQELGVDFKESFIIKVNKRSQLSFWDSKWLINGKLKTKFPRLFLLDSDKDARIVDRVHESDSGITVTSCWSRQPSGRTLGELSELQQHVSGYCFEETGHDTCSWALSHNGIFTLRSLSLILDDLSIANTYVEETMCNNLVPKKVEIFVWRLCKKRLPVKTELDKRGIDLHSVRYLLCDDDLETVEHSFIFCKCAMEVW